MSGHAVSGPPASGSIRCIPAGPGRPAWQRPCPGSRTRWGRCCGRPGKGRTRSCGWPPPRRTQRLRDRYGSTRRPRPFDRLPGTRLTAADRRRLWDLVVRLSGLSDPGVDQRPDLPRHSLEAQMTTLARDPRDDPAHRRRIRLCRRLLQFGGVGPRRRDSAPARDGPGRGRGALRTRRADRADGSRRWSTGSPCFEPPTRVVLVGPVPA